MLDLRRLDLLYRFAEHGSIAATAAALGYSASAVSQQLATLEREAGVPLLDRTARSATLTDAGRALARHAGTILGAVETAEAVLAATAERPSGRVEICAVPTAAVHFAPTLARLQSTEPELELVVRQSGPERAVGRLRSRQADVAIVDSWVESAPSAGLVRSRLLTDPLVAAVPSSHPLAEIDAPLDLHRVADEPWICAPSGEGSRAAFDRVMAEVHVEPSRTWEFEGLATIVALVAHGVGLALVPSLAIPRPVPSGLAVRTPRPGATRWIDAVIRRSSRDRPATQVTLAALRAAAPPAPVRRRPG